jgi:carbon starvation protein CstA
MVIFILGYYFVATVFPFDKIIGKLYPTLSIILIFATILIFAGACSHNPTTIPEI